MRVGVRSNHSSKTCAPVSTTRPRGIRCSSTASRACTSFQTNTRSGTNFSEPLLVRLSQLVTKIPAGIPSARALFSSSTSLDTCRNVPVTTTTSGADSRTNRSTSGREGTASSSAAVTPSTFRERSASVRFASLLPTRTASARPSGSNSSPFSIRPRTRCLVRFRSTDAFL